jgi:hypothetical protein
MRTFDDSECVAVFAHAWFYNSAPTVSSIYGVVPPASIGLLYCHWVCLIRFVYSLLYLFNTTRLQCVLTSPVFNNTDYKAGDLP